MTRKLIIGALTALALCAPSIAAAQATTRVVGVPGGTPVDVNIVAGGGGGGSSAITSVIPGVGATNLGKAEDAAAVSGDTGVAILGVRQDTITTSVGADGDYGVIKFDASGRVYVKTDSQSTVAAIGSVASGATDSGAPVKIGCKYNSTLPTVTDGQRVDCQANSKGLFLNVLARDTDGVPVSVGAANTDNLTAGTITLRSQAFLMGYDGAAYDRVLIDGNAALRVNPGAAFPVVSPAAVTSATTLFTADVFDAAAIGIQVISAGTSSTITYTGSIDGTNYVNLPCQSLTQVGTATPQPTSTAAGIYRCSTVGLKSMRAAVTTYGSGSVSVAYQLSSTPISTNGQGVNVSNSSIAVGGLNASGATATGNPVTMAGADASNTSRRLLVGGSGALQVAPAVGDFTYAYAGATSGIVNTTTPVTVRAAQATQKNCVTGIQVATDTLGAATELALRDGSANVLWRTKLQTGPLPATGFTFPTPICSAATNTLLEVVTLTATVTGGVYVDVQGFSP